MVAGLDEVEAKLAAGVPAATAEVGDKRGVLLGYTAGFAERAQEVYVHGEAADVDPGLAKKLGLRGPELRFVP